MRQDERDLLAALGEDSDAFDSTFEASFDGDNADAPLVAPKNRTAGGASLGRSANKPLFKAQFDLSVIPVYYDVTVATGVHAVIAPAALPATLKVNTLAAFLFGNSDYASGFAFAKTKFVPTGGWAYLRSYVYNSNEPAVIPDGGGAVYAFPSQVSSQLQDGDLVSEYYYDDAGGVTDNKAIVIVRCQQVAYGTLLDSISSDRFVISQLRYTIADTTKTAQFSNQIKLLRQSLFGKSFDDKVSPQSFKDPNQFQNGIIDIPLVKGIDKETVLATFLNYDVGQFDWSIFVWKTKKVLA